MSTVRLLVIGDVVGAPGLAMIQKYIPKLRAQYDAAGVIVNGENSADGRGITPRIMKFFKHNHVDIVTSGNHIWQKKEIYQYLSTNKDLLRPLNFPTGNPGTGMTIIRLNDTPVGVINIQGRVFMREHVSCPFRALDSALTYLKTLTKIIIVDVHAETTSEKSALAYYLDGQVSAVVGTHTHVPTADERILPKGTAFVTDLGMVGALNSVLGVKAEAIIRHLTTQMPARFEVETQGPFIMTGVVITIDTGTGRAESIERIKILDSTLTLESTQYRE